GPRLREQHAHDDQRRAHQPEVAFLAPLGAGQLHQHERHAEHEAGGQHDRAPEGGREARRPVPARTEGGGRARLHPELGEAKAAWRRPMASRCERLKPPTLISNGRWNTSGTNEAARKMSASRSPSVSQRLSSFTKVASTSLKSSQKPRRRR